VPTQSEYAAVAANGQRYRDSARAQVAVELDQMMTDEVTGDDVPRVAASGGCLDARAANVRHTPESILV